MSKGIVMILLIFSGQLLWATTEKEVASTIKEVIVFQQGAQVTRKGSVQVPSGRNILKFSGISPNIDPNSVQFSATGEFTILSVKHQINYFQPLAPDAEQERLMTEQKRLQEAITLEQTLMQVLAEEESMILANKSIGGAQSGVSIEDLKATAAFYRERLREIKLERLEMTKKVAKLQEDLNKVNGQMNEITGKNKKESTSEILVAVDAKSATNSNFQITYRVYAAGWTSDYDIRVKDVDSPVGLHYKGKVYQSSGEDWKDVQLTLSTGNPQQAGVKPNLQPWWLYPPSYPGVALRGSRERSESYALDAVDDEVAPKEAASAAYAPVQQVENTTSVEFRIQTPYDIPTDGQAYTVGIEQYELPATYEYYVAPKLNTNAFLTAKVTDWEQYHLMSGAANLFFENTYMGQTALNMQNTQDTITLSLGVDKSIVVTRTKQEQYSDKQLIGNKVTKTIGWEIEVRNKKKANIQIVIEDQIPLATNDEMEIELVKAKDAKVDTSTGKLRWEFDLKGGKTEKLEFRYDVKHLKKVNLILE
ncbi:MAG: hypothetical protein DHS20C18_51120 [Saprospiraceae bacterium]|nr:MAG: hypothetical protein DHS20C18_51120 [Saprospiraceae bacterium]